MTEIISGIYQIRLPIPNNPLENTNVYLVRGDSECLLIDAGWNDEAAFQSFKKQLTEIGLSGKDISQIIVTHAHRDHYGLAGRLAQLSRARISLHYQEINLLLPRYRNMEEFIHQTDRWFHSHGVPPNELPTAQAALAGMGRSGSHAQPDTTLKGGETIPAGAFKLKVLWTPGHSPGHICLYEPNKKILFAGDHVLPVITPNVSLPPQSELNPLGDFINSLSVVKQLDVSLVLPAHEQIFTDLPARVEQIIQHHKHRNFEILEAIKAEPRTAYQISNEITWMPELGGARFQDLAPWDKRMAVSETLAHLQAMTKDGVVTRSRRDDIYYYRRG